MNTKRRNGDDNKNDHFKVTPGRIYILFLMVSRFIILISYKEEVRMKRKLLLM